MRIFIVFTVLITLISGCASVPPEAANLSDELGKRISALEKANTTLLNRYFDQKRAEVDRFIEKVWLPEFAKELFQKPAIANTWNKIVVEDNEQQRLEFLVRTGPKLQEAINNKRAELIRPLDNLESHILKNLKDEYDQARGINNSITSFLVSASEVDKNHKRYMETLGIADSKVATFIDKTDDAVNDLLATAHQTTDKVHSAKEFADNIKHIKDSIK